MTQVLSTETDIAETRNTAKNSRQGISLAQKSSLFAVRTTLNSQDQTSVASSIASRKKLMSKVPAKQQHTKSQTEQHLSLSQLQLTKLEDPVESLAMAVHAKNISNHGHHTNTLYRKMRRQFSNLRQVEREDNLQNQQRTNDKFMSFPKNACMRRQQPQILKPTDTLEDTMPPQYQHQLDRTYRSVLGKAISRQSLHKCDEADQTNQKCKERKRNLTNAQHYAMSQNHLLMAQMISEHPHHYFTLEHTELAVPQNRLSPLQRNNSPLLQNHNTQTRRY